MNAVVPKFAGAPIPEPVPIIVYDIVLEGPLGSRPLPQCIIEPVGNRRRLAAANGWALIGVPGTSKKQFAEFTSMQSSDGLDDPRPTAALVAHLNNTLMSARRRDHELAFAQIVAAGLLDIDVLAGGASENGGRRVPMIRCRYRDRIHVRIIQHAA